jgi:hypothetical protein
MERTVMHGLQTERAPKWTVFLRAGALATVPISPATPRFFLQFRKRTSARRRACMADSSDAFAGVSAPRRTSWRGPEGDGGRIASARLASTTCATSWRPMRQLAARRRVGPSVARARARVPVRFPGRCCRPAPPAPIRPVRKDAGAGPLSAATPTPAARRARLHGPSETAGVAERANALVNGSAECAARPGVRSRTALACLIKRPLR